FQTKILKSRVCFFPWPPPRHSVKLTAFRVYRVHQRRHIFRRGVLGNAMPEVEHMTISISVACQYLDGLLVDDVWRSQQDSRIEVSLQRDTIPHAGACLAYV